MTNEDKDLYSQLDDVLVVARTALRQGIAMLRVMSEASSDDEDMQNALAGVCEILEKGADAVDGPGLEGVRAHLHTQRYGVERDVAA